MSEDTHNEQGTVVEIKRAQPLSTEETVEILQQLHTETGTAISVLLQMLTMLSGLINDQPIEKRQPFMDSVKAMHEEFTKASASLKKLG